MTKIHTQLTCLAIASAILLSGCGDKNLEVKPYPKHLGQINKILYNNKGYWIEDLKEDMDGFDAFEKKTFSSVNAFKKRYAIRYGVSKKNNKTKIPEKQDFNGDFDEIIDEQY